MPIHSQQLSLPTRWVFASWRSSRKGARGFTLIELMVTVAIVAILAAVAYPSYTRYVVRSKRSAAQGFLLEVTNFQQRYLLDRRSYANAPDVAAFEALMATPSNVKDNYDITTVPTTGALPGFTATATPKGSQATADNTCGTLTINEKGVKGASGGGTSCW